MCWCRGACLLDLGEKSSRVRETKKRICAEYRGNAPVPWWLLFECGFEKFVGTEDNEENIVRICGKSAGVMMPAFWMWGTISSVRERIRRIC